MPPSDLKAQRKNQEDAGEGRRIGQQHAGCCWLINSAEDASWQRRRNMKTAACRAWRSAPVWLLAGDVFRCLALRWVLLFCRVARSNGCARGARQSGKRTSAPRYYRSIYGWHDA